MRIRSQLITVLATAALVAAAAIASLAYIAPRNAEALRSQAESQEVARLVSGLVSLTLERVAHGGERTTTSWRAGHAQLAQAVQAALARNPNPDSALVALRDQVVDAGLAFDRLAQPLSKDRAELTDNRLNLSVERLVTEAQQMVEAQYRWTAAMGQARADDQQMTAVATLLGEALLLLVAAAVAFIIWRDVVKPLDGLYTSVAAIQAGQFDVRADTGVRNELGDVARALDSLALSLRANNRALRDEIEQRTGAEQRLQLVVDNVPAMVGQMDVDWRYTAINQAYVSWHARPSAEIVGHLIHEVNTADNYARLKPYLERAFAGESVQFEVELSRAGELRTMQVTYVAERDALGKVTAVYSTKLDITALRMAERQLRQVMEASPLGIFTRDASGQCFFTNRAWQQIAGMSLEQSLGEGWRQAVHANDKQMVDADWREALASGQPHVSEYRYRRSDGSVAWVRSHLAPLHGVGYDAGAVGTVEDITSRRELDRAMATTSAELARSNTDLEQFAYIAAHDLQEPLRMVANYTELLAKRYQGQLDAKADKYIFYAVDGAQRMQQLILGLLAYSRVGSQGKPLVPVRTEVSLQRVLNVLQVAIKDSGAVIEATALPMVMGDEGQLDQLFQNLLGNAIKFRSTAPLHITVAAAAEGGHWLFTVKDNGIGVEPQHAERIFQIFQRLHERGKYEGSGIGLSIVKRIVERHGGRIWLDLTPGAGTTFHFTLMAVPALEPASND